MSSRGRNETEEEVLLSDARARREPALPFSAYSVDPRMAIPLLQPPASVGWDSCRGATCDEADEDGLAVDCLLLLC